MVKLILRAMFYIMLAFVILIGIGMLYLYWDMLDHLDKAFILSISSILITFYSLIWVIHQRAKRHGNHLPHHQTGHQHL